MFVRLHQLCTIQIALLALGCTEQPSPASSEQVVTAFSTPGSDRPPEPPRLTVELPLLETFLAIDGVSDLGLRFTDELAPGDYYCTPRNTVAFAWTGGDGEHFSLLAVDNVINENSPVILTAPSNSNDENRLIAVSFRDFLRLGIRNGFAGLREFAYRPDEALAAYGVADWKPGEDWLAPDDHQQRTLNSIAELLELEPLSYTSEEFASLQEQLQTLLEPSPN